MTLNQGISSKHNTKITNFFSSPNILSGFFKQVLLYQNKFNKKTLPFASIRYKRQCFLLAILSRQSLICSFLLTRFSSRRNNFFSNHRSHSFHKKLKFYTSILRSSRSGTIISNRTKLA